MPTVEFSEALNKIEAMANKYYDGHYTIMKFTTGYKVFFGTPQMETESYQKILNMPIFKNITIGIVNAVIKTYEV